MDNGDNCVALSGNVKHFGSGIELVATVARPWMRRSNHGLATVATLMARFLPAENASQRSLSGLLFGTATQSAAPLCPGLIYCCPCGADFHPWLTAHRKR